MCNCGRHRHYEPPTNEERNKREAKPKRTVKEICVDADNNRHNRVKLKSLILELITNEEKYSKVEFGFMDEHIHGYIDAIDDRAQSKRELERLNED